MKIPGILDLVIKIWPARVCVIVNLFGEVHLPAEGPRPAAMSPKVNYNVNVNSADEYSKRQKPTDD